MTDHAVCKTCGTIAPVGEEYCERCGLKRQLEKTTEELAKVKAENVVLDRQLCECRARMG